MRTNPHSTNLWRAWSWYRPSSKVKFQLWTQRCSITNYTLWLLLLQQQTATLHRNSLRWDWAREVWFFFTWFSLIESSVGSRYTATRLNWSNICQTCAYLFHFAEKRTLRYGDVWLRNGNLKSFIVLSWTKRYKTVLYSASERRALDNVFWLSSGRETLNFLSLIAVTINFTGLRLVAIGSTIVLYLGLILIRNYSY